MSACLLSLSLRDTRTISLSDDNFSVFGSIHVFLRLSLSRSYSSNSKKRRRLEEDEDRNDLATKTAELEKELAELQENLKLQEGKGFQVILHVT